MSPVVVSSLYLMSGICVYAGTNHLFFALRRPLNRTHLLFAGMCLLMVPFALAHTVAIQATDIAGLVLALKWNLAAIFLFFFLFLWFIRQYTGVRPKALPVGLSALFTVLFVVNLVQLHSLQYDDISGLKFVRLPWGDVLTRPIGHNGAWTYSAVAGALAAFGYAFYALGSLYRRGRSRTALVMLFAVGVFLVSAIDGILVRLSIIDFVELGPFGYLAVVVAMSAALNHETRLRQRESERRFRSLVDQSPFSIQVLSPEGQTRQVNQTWETLWGIKAEALQGYNILQDQQLIEKGVMPYIERGFAGETTEIPPVVYNPADNPVVTGPFRDNWVRSYIYPIKDGDGVVSDVILMHEDVTEKKRVDDAIKLIATGVSGATGEQFFRQLVQSLAKIFDADYAFIGVLDEQDKQRVSTLAVWAHGAIAPNFGYSLAGTPCENVVGQSTCAYQRDVQRLFPEDRLLAEMGVEGYIGTPLFDTQGGALGILAVLDSKPIRNIEQIKEILGIYAARAGAELSRQQAEARIRRMAYEDYLTGLPSRAAFLERLGEALASARQTGRCSAILLIDLDHFKTINDALSHDIGDDMLRVVGKLLQDIIAGHGFVARLGGDEYAVMLKTGSADLREVEREAGLMAQQIMEKLSAPILVHGSNFTIGASIGVKRFPMHDEKHELDVLRHAEMALYRAKELGRGNVQFYLPKLQAEADTQLLLEGGLRCAIANNELALHFQPQINKAGRMIGSEVLLRWNHAEMGNIPPGKFIPIAEETGLIIPIGTWVFEHACGCLKRWLQTGVPFDGHLSINVSPWQFAQPDFVRQVGEVLAKYQIEPGRLMLELTETILLRDFKEVVEKLRALRSMGLRVALDDFGTGYSSLAYLRDLPLDQIKIDKSFIDELNEVSEYALVETMIAIGRHMQVEVIAEGVETEAQCALLAKLGCESFQGYLFSRPLPENIFLSWLSARQAA